MFFHKLKICLLVIFCLYSLAACDTCSNGTDNSSPGDSTIIHTENTNDGDAQLAVNDIDGDTILNENDNCPETYNTDQTDSDGDGIGNACDEDYVGEKEDVDKEEDVKDDDNEVASTLNPYFSENKVAFFAGAYNWKGYADGITTAKFMKDNGYTLEQIFSAADPGKALYDLAMSKSAGERPAKLANIYPVRFYHDNESDKSFLYYTGYSNILYRLDLAAGVTQKVAFNTAKTGSDNGITGKEATGKSFYDMEIADSQIGSKISKGDVILADRGNQLIRVVKVNDVGGSITSTVSTVVFVSQPLKIAVRGGKIYVLSQQNKPGGLIGECLGVYEINSAYQVNQLIPPDKLSPSCNGYDIDLLADDSFIYTLGKSAGGYSEIRRFNRDNGAPVGVPYSGSEINDARGLEWVPPVEGLIAGYNYMAVATYDKLLVISNPADGDVTIYALGGGGQGWQEKISAESGFKLAMNDSASMTFSSAGDTLYFNDIKNNIIRSVNLKYAKVDEKLGIEMISSELLLGIPYFSSAGSLDGSDPYDVRFKLMADILVEPDHLLVSDRWNGVRMVKLGAEDGLYKETLTLVNWEDPDPSDDNNNTKFAASKNLSGLAKDGEGNLYVSQIVESGDDPLKICNVFKIPKEAFDFANHPAVKDRNGLIENFICEGDFDKFKPDMVNKPSISAMEYFNGYFYAPDASNNVIWKIGLDKNVEIFAGAIGKAGYSEYNKEIPITDKHLERLNKPSSITSLNGKLYVYDAAYKIIYEIKFEGKASTMTMIAGCFGGGKSDGIGDKACFTAVNDLASYYDNKIVVADMYAPTIRMLDINTHEVTTVVGKYLESDYFDGSFEEALFSRPLSVACSAGSKMCFLGDEQALRVIK